ncbi:MAG: head GIN domain-containing protein [Sphingobacteriales bacterium]
MRSFIKVLLFAVLVAGTGYGMANPRTAARTKAAEVVDRHLSGFNAVNVAGPFDVDIVQGATESVKVEAPADVIDRIITEVNGGVLKIYNRHDSWNWGEWWGHHKKILVHVTAKDLNSINITGSGDVSFREGITTNSLKLRISGSGDMTGKLAVKTLESSITGSGDMKLSGRAESSTVSLVGSGDFTARNLITVSSAVRVSGSGDAEINASEKVDAAVNGSGDIRYTGAAKNINSRKSGSGDISRN